MRIARFELRTASLDDVFLTLTRDHAHPETPESESQMSEYAVQPMITRAFRLSLRNVDGMMTALILPVILMLMFVYLFGGAISTGTRYVDYVVPGVLLVCIGFGSGTTAVTVANDLAGGIIDRFRSMDVRGEALINGHVVASVVRNLLSAAVVLVVAFAIGFRPHADVAAWLAAAGILALFVLALSWLAAAIGIVGSFARGGARGRLPGQLLPVREQRVRPDSHDAGRAAGRGEQSAGDRGRRLDARAAERRARRRRRVARRGLEHRDRLGVDRAVRGPVPQSRAVR